MDLTQNHKAAIISVGCGHWYGIGINRLERSLVYSGWAGDMRFWRDLPTNCPPHEGAGQYNFKPIAFKQMFDDGYTHVLWLDASVYAVKNPMKVFDYISDHGLLLFKSGYSIAQTATDLLLSYCGIADRSSLQHVSEFATGMVGINILNPIGKEFFERWYKMMEDGMFGGSRVHDPADSQHPMFVFSRQDQSCSSIVLHQMGITTAGEDQDFISYYGTPANENKVTFLVQGM